MANRDTATTGNGKVDAREIAWWAEKAHGYIGSGLSLVATRAGKYELKESMEEGDRLLLEVSTPPRVPNRMPKPQIQFQAPGCAAEWIHDAGDALFWTESSIEKFLFPYYHAQRLLTDEEMNALKASFIKREVVAFIHVPPSQTFAKTAGQTILVLEGRAGGQGMDRAMTWTPLTDYLARL